MMERSWSSKGSKSFGSAIQITLLKSSDLCLSLMRLRGQASLNWPSWCLHQRKIPLTHPLQEKLVQTERKWSETKAWARPSARRASKRAVLNKSREILMQTMAKRPHRVVPSCLSSLNLIQSLTSKWWEANLQSLVACLVLIKYWIRTSICHQPNPVKMVSLLKKWIQLKCKVSSPDSSSWWPKASFSKLMLTQTTSI